MKLLICLVAVASTLSAQDAAPIGWKLAWSDEFDGAAGAPPDSAKWTYDVGATGWGNRELENYTKDPKNAHTDGKGNLAIHVERVPTIDATTAGAYTSARLKTQGLFSIGPVPAPRLDVRVETRAKIPSGAGYWPAFWMLGDGIASKGWPACGEIDIMESIGREPTMNHGSLHGPGYSGGSPKTSIYTLPDGKKFADDFHTFAIEWSTSAVTLYVDGIAYNTVHRGDIPSGTQWVFDQPEFLLLNVAVGGNFGGPVSPQTVFPQDLLVDYVRVYTRQQ